MRRRLARKAKRDMADKAREESRERREWDEGAKRNGGMFFHSPPMVQKRKKREGMGTGERFPSGVV
jgi:hypothetical protein